MASLQSIVDAVQEVRDTLDMELGQIADALANASPTQEEIDAVAVTVTDLRDRIRNIIPD